jgi:hypothetical protein
MPIKTTSGARGKPRGPGRKRGVKPGTPLDRPDPISAAPVGTRHSPLTVPEDLTPSQQERWRKFSKDAPWLQSFDAPILRQYVILVDKAERQYKAKPPVSMSIEIRKLHRRLRFHKPPIADEQPKHRGPDGKYWDPFNSAHNPHRYAPEVFARAPRLCSKGLLGIPGYLDGQLPAERMHGAVMRDDDHEN